MYGEIIGTKLFGLGENPEYYTRSGVDKLYCIDFRKKKHDTEKKMRGEVDANCRV